MSRLSCLRPASVYRVIDCHVWRTLENHLGSMDGETEAQRHPSDG